MTSDPCTRRSHPCDTRCAAGIDIRLAHYRAIADAATQDRLRAVLSAEERHKEQRFHFADDRMRYLVTRALVRDTLSRHAPLPAEHWLFEDTEYGRPRIANGHAGCADLSFNISHTGGLVALAVTRGRALGIDVENVAARRASPGIAARFFAPAELRALAAVPGELWHERFFEYWTFKEAYIKARGMGLSLPLDRFSIQFPADGAVTIAIDDELGDDPGRWCLWQLRPAPDYLLALCAERTDGGAPALTVGTVEPGPAGGPLFVAAG